MIRICSFSSCRRSSTLTFHFCSMASWPKRIRSWLGKNARIELRCAEMPDRSCARFTQRDPRSARAAGNPGGSDRGRKRLRRRSCTCGARSLKSDPQNFRNVIDRRWARAFRGRAEIPARSRNCASSNSPPTFWIKRRGCRRRPAGREQVIDQHNFLAGLDAVDMHLHFGVAVFERVGRALGLEGQLALSCGSGRSRRRARRRPRTRKEIRARRSRPLLSIGRVRQRSRKTSIDSRKSCASTRIGVMSLKTMPCFGKLGTSRTPARRRSIESATMAGG